MKAFVCSILFFMHISLNYGALPFSHYKCWIWNSACLTASAQAITRTLASGVPEIGTERLDPMFIDFIYINEDGFQFDMRNVYIEGLKNTIVDKVNVDMNSRVMRLVFHADLFIKSLYTAGGYIFALPITGHGDFELKYSNILFEMIIPFEIIKNIQGKNVINLKEYQYWYDVRGGAQYRLDNLYYGDKKSSDIMHVLLNQNWKSLSLRYGRHLYDKVNDKIFNTIRTYLLSQTLENIFY